MLFPRTLHTLKPQQAVICNSLMWNVKLFNLLTSIPRQDKTSIFAELLDSSSKKSSLASLQWLNLTEEQQQLTHQALAYVQVSLQATQQMWSSYQASLSSDKEPHSTVPSMEHPVATNIEQTAKATNASPKEFTRTIIDDHELEDIYDPNLALLHHSDYKQRHSYEIPVDHPSYRELLEQGETLVPNAPSTEFTISSGDRDFFSAEFEGELQESETPEDSLYRYDFALVTRLAQQAGLIGDNATLPSLKQLGLTTLADQPTVAQIVTSREIHELVLKLSQDLDTACTQLVGAENFSWDLSELAQSLDSDQPLAAWNLWVLTWMLLSNTSVSQLCHAKLLTLGAKFHLQALPWQKQLAQTSFQTLESWDETTCELIGSTTYLRQSLSPREAEKVLFPALQELTTLQYKLPSYLEMRESFRVHTLEARHKLYRSIYHKLASAPHNRQILAALSTSQTQVTPVLPEQSFTQWLPAQLESLRYLETRYLQANYTLNYLNATGSVVVQKKRATQPKLAVQSTPSQEQDGVPVSPQVNSSALHKETGHLEPQQDDSLTRYNSTTSETRDALLKFTLLELETPTSSNPWHNLGLYAELPAVPNRLNCFDVSHLNGEFTKASCVVRDAQGIVPHEYRHYNITGITPGDDMAAMAQATFKRLDGIVDLSEVPDILLIDGKTTQCKAANLVYVQYQALINQKAVFANLLNAGQQMAQFMAQHQNRLYAHQVSNQLSLLAFERLYQLSTKPYLELQALGLAPLSWDTGLRLATAVQQLQINNARLGNALGMILAIASMHEERWAQHRMGPLESLASLRSIPNSQPIALRKLNWLAQQPLETTFSDFFTQVHLLEYLARNLHPCAIVGVYKQLNRKTHAELFLNGRTNTNINIAPYSSEQFILLDLRDRAHNYANTKRIAAQDKTMHDNHDLLASIPGLGQISLQKIYHHFQDTGALLAWYQSDGSLAYLVTQVGLTKKAAQALLDKLPSLFPTR